MKVSDYIVEYLIGKNITDVFGYPGGMVTHLMDSFSKYDDKISAHITYHEQGAAFAACGYAQARNTIGVAYATSGPGATNLITGICNAYFDSIPVLFITGQVNTFERRAQYKVRQRGFQETDIVSMVTGVTKYAVQIEKAEDIKKCLDEAFEHAMDGRKGPVLLDIPMNIFRSDINESDIKNSVQKSEYISGLSEENYEKIKSELLNAKRPVLLLGNGLKSICKKKVVKQILEKINIPAVSTMLAVDIMGDVNLNYGFIGAYGSRVANFVIAKSDLVISLGARLDIRQVGAKRDNFASDARLIRVDIDPNELDYKVHSDEIQINADATNALMALEKIVLNAEFNCNEWLGVCDTLKSKLKDRDRQASNLYVERISQLLPENALITTDVGQNQVWVAQSLCIKGMQEVFFSGGHGAMGYSLPAAIGCQIATNKPTYSFNGDGGFQMNIQELQTIVREKLPIKIIIFNNSSLGMIRHFQEMYFESNYYQTIEDGGYTTPDFDKIANGYSIDYVKIKEIDELRAELFNDEKARVIEIVLEEDTYVCPKLEYGKPNQDQSPFIERELYNYLMSL